MGRREDGEEDHGDEESEGEFPAAEGVAVMRRMVGMEGGVSVTAGVDIPVSICNYISSSKWSSSSLLLTCVVRRSRRRCRRYRRSLRYRFYQHKKRKDNKKKNKKKKSSFDKSGECKYENLPNF